MLVLHAPTIPKGHRSKKVTPYPQSFIINLCELIMLDMVDTARIQEPPRVGFMNEWTLINFPTIRSGDFALLLV